MKLKIYLFRHGQSYYNKHGWFTGWIDSKMTKAGFANAKAVAKKLKTKKIDVAYHSRLSRSKDTLKEVLKYHPECIEVIEDDRMIERCYGKLQKHSHKEFMEDIEDLICKSIEKKYGKMRPKTKRHFGEEVAKTVYDIYHRSYDIPPPGGESVKMVEKRVNSFIKDLLKKMKKEKINVAISAHGNSMRPFRKYFEKLTLKEMMKLEN
ncbi:MAG: 2,3-bisphosphoglycerate-dependent phosphoglycerate mutase, partial [Nanoarchaeota archaeon]|nr:2,3-bisphosphoglycerate-dependent phosphoglycerate mutase [Nanoarchaeota archaeon]